MADEEQAIVASVPRDESSRLELLSRRPLAWEYLLFGGALLTGLQRTEPKWRDYHLGYTTDIGPSVTMAQLPAELHERMTRASYIVGNVEKVVSQRAQDAAFGLPDQEGDPGLIEHMADRLIMLYEQLLDWANDVRSLRVEKRAERLPELCAAMVAQPIEACRRFVSTYTQELETSLAKIAAGSDEPVVISMVLRFDLDEAVTKAFEKELKRAVRG